MTGKEATKIINECKDKGFKDAIIDEIENLPSVNPKNVPDINVGNIDCISREDAIRIASGYCHFSNIPEELKKLPSVKLPSAVVECDDAISRKEAIEQSTAEGAYDYLSTWEIRKMPSVVPVMDRKYLIGEIRKLQTYKTHEGGDKLVELDSVVAILEKGELE